MRRLVVAAVVVGGAWAAWQGAGFVLSPATRHRAESAWFIFAFVLLAAGFISTRRAPRPPEGPRPARAWNPGWAMLAFVAASVLLYAPVLGIGLLSDDFVLLERARDGALVDPRWDYVRPLPLALWRLIDAVLPPDAVPGALHLLNAVLHGFNAWLVFVVSGRLWLPQRAAWLGALLFLAWPSNVEAVAWASGIFDVLMTTFILGAAVALSTGTLSVPARVAWISILAGAALATKETAVAFPLLLALLVPFLRRAERRAAIVAVLTTAGATAVYSGWRITFGDPTAHLFPASGYALKELLSRPFGAMGLGLHADVTAAVPMLALAIAILWPLALVAAAIRWQREPTSFHALLFAAGWLLVSVLPLSTMFFVGLDLQGSRYLYLGSAMFAVGLMAILAGGEADASEGRTGIVVASTVLAVAVAIVIAHQRPWARAAQARDLVLAALHEVPRNCALLDVSDLPDHVDGAYVFRNGFAEAAAEDRGAPAPGGTTCALRWNGRAFVPRP